MKGKFILPRLTTIFWACLPMLACAQKKSPSPKPTAKPIVAASVAEVPKWISYEILDNGDTINRMDAKGIKQGRWLIEYPAHYEEPAFMEVGSYEQGQKTGLWQTHHYNGVLVSEENFKKGLKDGEARYYEDGQLLCVGHYLALNAKNLYDTVMVEQANTEGLKPVVVKTDVGSIRHGVWTYYEPPSKDIKRMVEYQADDIVFDTTYNQLTHNDTLFMQQKMKTLPHANPKATAGDWIDTKNRKRIKYTDLPDNMSVVKPNVRKK